MFNTSSRRSSSFGGRSSSRGYSSSSSFGGRSRGGYSSRGGFSSRSSFGGRGGSRSRAPKRAYIDPSRYINKVVTEKLEEMYQPKHSFEDFGLDPQLLKNVLQHGYTTPTPIQDQVIPLLIEGKDVVGIANTGTGKTAAFLLPLVNKIAMDPNQGALILAPTRELALQIDEELTAFAKYLKLGVCLCIGGTSISSQVSKLRNNPHFVIGTPGRLKDLIQRNAFHPELFTNIVLDEVDRMLDIGFRKDIQFLIGQLPEEKQAAFFSATMNRETEEIMHGLMKNPVQISVSKRETSHHIHQDVITVQQGQTKIEVLHELLQQSDFRRVIVFGRTKHGVNKLEEDLSKRGIRVTSIHGNKTQSARQRSLDQFKRGRVQALLATDVAARGIDIDDVSHVINYDEPQSYEDYIHRIGRTGRAGKIGRALTFVS